MLFRFMVRNPHLGLRANGSPSILRQTFATGYPLFYGPSKLVPKPTLCETRGATSVTAFLRFLELVVDAISITAKTDLEAFLRLQQFAEPLRSQPHGTKNRAQGAAIQRLVIRNDNLTERFVTPQDDVAPDLADDTRKPIRSTARTQVRPETTGRWLTQ